MMKNFLKESFQPFEVVWSKIGDTFYILPNKGSVHSFFKPEIRVDIGDLIDISKEYDLPYELIDGKFLYLSVTMRRDIYPNGFSVGVPIAVSIDVGDEIPVSSDTPPNPMCFEVCRVDGGVVKQGICSDVWAGWKQREDDSSSSSSESSSESSQSSESGSDSSSSNSDNNSGDSESSNSSESSGNDSSSGSSDGGSSV